MLYANLRTRVKKDVIIHITRVLSGKGKIMVQKGQQVTPSDLIGQGMQLKGFRRISLAKILSENPKQAQQFLQRPVGSKIYKDELLAFKPAGFLSSKKIITSPTDGIIDYYDEKKGELQISFLPKMVDLPSGVFGIIDGINDTRGEIIIKTQATQIFGIGGSGRSREGILEIIGGRGDLINYQRIQSKYAGRILVGGGLIYNDAIYHAMSSLVHGIITGGINFKDYLAVSGRIKKRNMDTDIGLSVLVVEGFGGVSIGEDIFEILKKHSGRFVILDGNKKVLSLPSEDSNSLTKISKVGLPNDHFVDSENQEVAVEIRLGQTVRTIGSPLGLVGEVIGVDKKPTLLQSGISVYLLTIDTKFKKIKVPYTNVEVIYDE